MKKSIYFLIVLAVAFIFAACEKDFDEEPEMELKDAKIEKLTGFDQWGFNWNAHHFNGYLINAVMSDYLYELMPFYKWGEGPYEGEGVEFLDKFITEFGFFPLDPILLDCKLVMHWNDALINRDGTYPVVFWDYSNWENSNGWITFHFSMDKNGEKWSSFQKLVAKRTTDYLENEIWYDKNGDEIGLPTDWPTLIMVKKVNNGNTPYMFLDSYNSPLAPGLGKYKN
ncbi:hypothetical protein OU798_01260 [Prolixibacteraceae bacterium Z1-6]|uniref:Uncharacterized protein n=1 Tax=Draconibacterium aestuarii TaxID=2998507 RepID=A0A9X3J329_9BACT|nr:hypothetical protein [Prolixibacteraceae bacterium Z1-6]